MELKSVVWGNLLSWTPGEVRYPANLQEVIDLVRYAKSNNLKIRAAGSLHSLNSLCKTDEIQLFTDKLNRVLSIERRRNPSIKVEAGIKICRLLEILAEEGLTLPNQGYIGEQSIVGAITTATHGTGKTGTFCDFVEEIELVDANGELHHLTPQESPHLFSAALVNLGCLGVIYSVKLKCKPREKLKLSKVRGTLSKTLEELPVFLDEYDHFMMTLDPYSDQLFSWRFKKTECPLRFRNWYQFRRNFNKVFAILVMDYLYIPSFLMPYLLKLYMLFAPFRACVDYSDCILSPADEGHYVEEEIAVPLENLKEGLSLTRQVIARQGERGIRPVAVILIRFAEGDRYGYLSPALGRKTAYISLISLRNPGYDDLFREVETALYPLGGRPHWGKVHFLTHEMIVQLYKENYLKFIEAQQKLDPDGLFRNKYSEKLLEFPAEKTDSLLDAG